MRNFLIQSDSEESLIRDVRLNLLDVRHIDGIPNRYWRNAILINKIGSILGLPLFSQYSFFTKRIDEFKVYDLVDFSNEMVLQDQLFQCDSDVLRTMMLISFAHHNESNIYASFIPGSTKEKAFVRSKSLPREKQAGENQQRSDAGSRKTIRSEQSSGSSKAREKSLLCLQSEKRNFLWYHGNTRIIVSIILSHP